MKVYFFSEDRAALKLDGEYAGLTDGFPRFAEISGGAFAEWLPLCGEGVHFYLDEELFLRGREGLYAVRAEDERMLFLPRRQKAGLQGVAAQLFCGGTLYSLLGFGAAYVACDGPECALLKLGGAYPDACLREIFTEGERRAIVRGGGRLAVLCGARLTYEGPADALDESSGEVTVFLRDCADSVCTFSVLRPEERRITARRTPPPEAAHVALFESVLHGGDCGIYLSEELKGRADRLKSYLGDFCAAVPPTERARKKYGDGTAGLAYRTCEGVFEIKWFRTERENGLICNISPAER